MDSQQHEDEGARSRQLQAYSREVNERLRLFPRQDGRAEAVPLLCECGYCREWLEVAAAAYERSRASAGRLLVKRGHENGDAVRWQDGRASVVELVGPEAPAA